jgi:plastocyanin
VIAALAAGAALLLAPTGVTRPVQAYDRPIGYAPVWAPGELSAQPGDTIRWQFDEPGNPYAAGATHDLWLAAPGQPAARLGASSEQPAFEAVVDQEGTYAFYCAIHRDTMTATIAVAAGAPTAVVDPGRPWESPAPVVETGPPPAPNTTSPPTVFEEGDITAPTLTLRRVSRHGRRARVRVQVSEPGTLFVRVLHGRTRHARVKAGTARMTIRLPKRRCRLAVWVRDGAGLESRWRYRTVRA